MRNAVELFNDAPNQPLLDRRQALVGILAGASLPLLPSVARAAGNALTYREYEQLEKGRSYTEPEFEVLADWKEIHKQEVCYAARYDEPTASTLKHHGGAKVFVNSEGDLTLETLENLRERGWIAANRRRRASSPSPSSNRAANGKPKPRPDIKPSTGSCSIVELEKNGKTSSYIFSNDHVVFNAREEIDQHSISDPYSDFNILPLEHSERVLGDQFEIKRSVIAGDDITNDNITDQEVEIIGIGADLFHFKGKPFKVPAKVTLANGDERTQDFFALKVPNNFLHRPWEISGMSGSPVTTPGTREMVGIISRIFFTADRSGNVTTILLFAGPDELQTLVDKVEE